MNWRLSATLLTLSAAACGTAPAPRPAAGQTADLVIVNGRVFTADERDTTAQAVATAGNKILLVGTNDAVSALRGPLTRVVDARGGTVAPGFNDSHVHFISGGMTLGQVDLAGLTTLAQVQDKIRAFAAAHADAAWVEGRGWLYSPFPGGTPTREQLDAVVSDRPAVMTCYDGHSVWVNSKALALAGITKETPNPTNGLIVKEPEDGRAHRALEGIGHGPAQHGQAEAHRRRPACRIAHGRRARAPVRRHERAERRHQLR